MDELVLEGQKKWPNVPHAYGYLALSALGNWHLYTTAHTVPDFSLHSRVTSPALQQFIARNYAVDERGCWYFQNGPQRVYVMLEKAPLVLQLDANLQLRTQSQQLIEHVNAWYVNDAGELYLQSNAGCGLIAGRDLPVFVEQLQLVDGTPLLDYLAEYDTHTLNGMRVLWPVSKQAISQSASVYYTQDHDLPKLSGFVRLPAPSPTIDQSSL